MQDGEKIVLVVTSGVVSVITGVVGYLAQGWVTRKADAQKAGLLDVATVYADTAKIREELWKRVGHLEERLDEAETETEKARREAEDARRLHADCERRVTALSERVAVLEREKYGDRGPGPQR
jgi:chromosome segregation ATPase